MSIRQLQLKIISCNKCPRLVRWREKIAQQKVRRFANEEYWGKPIPSFGDPKGQLLLIGLAPAAHGGNRTGRIFTGDRSGDWLYRALYKAGFASQPISINRNDGLKLTNCYISAACRCAPPQNKLLPSEISNCRPYILEEFRLLKHIRVIIGLGKIGFDTIIASLEKLNHLTLIPKPSFSHGCEYHIQKGLTIIGSYHPSQQNTFTGKLTEAMFDSIFRRARKLLER
jgi:uracil-DNA glycosylase family 4